MIVVSRYTNTGKYPEFAARLRTSCERFGLPYSIGEIKHRGDWHTTDIDKPNWLLDVMFQARKSVCWFDADCVIRQYPTLLIDPACTFAAYNWAADPTNPVNATYDPNRLVASGGVLFFRYDAAAIELLLRWHQGCMETTAQAGSDPPLNEAYNTARPPVRPLWLPKAYNRMDIYWPEIKPVIDHTFQDRGHGEKEADNLTAAAAAP